MPGRLWLAVWVAMAGSLAGCMPEGEVLVKGHQGVQQVAVDATHVYWTEPGKVWRVPRAGGAEEQLGTSSGAPRGLATNGSAVAWLTEDEQHLGTLTLRLLAGAEQVDVATGIDRPTGVVMDADRVFWTAASDGSPSEDPLANDGLVLAAPLDGGAPAPFLTGLRTPYQLGLSGGQVLVGSLDRVLRAPTAGGDAEVVLRLVQYQPRTFAVGDHVVFWEQVDALKHPRYPLIWAPLGSGLDGVHILLPAPAVLKLSLAARGDTLFFASPAAVWRMETTDTEPTLLAASTDDLTLKPLRGFAIDDRRAYWTTLDGVGTVELR